MGRGRSSRLPSGRTFAVSAPPPILESLHTRPVRHCPRFPVTTFFLMWLLLALRNTKLMPWLGASCPGATVDSARAAEPESRLRKRKHLRGCEGCGGGRVIISRGSELGDDTSRANPCLKVRGKGVNLSGISIWPTHARGLHGGGAFQPVQLLVAFHGSWSICKTPPVCYPAF